MPKHRRLLSAVLLVWLCVMLVAFTYTWVSRNWTPSIKSDDISVASSGALVISVLGDDQAVYEEVSLNDVVGIGVDNSFTFRQVSSQNGINFFWKDFTPTLTDEEPFYEAITSASDPHRNDYIEAQFCLKLDDSLDTPEEAKYIFIHPETMIENVEEIAEADLKKAIRISLTFDKEIVSSSGSQVVTETVILAHLDDEDNTGAVNANGYKPSDEYRAVLSDADGKTDAQGALGYQTVYGLQYFNCGRESFIHGPFNEANYNFQRDESRALFKLNPGETKWITMRIWLEGQDEANCIKEIAGKKFNMVLKFDSAFVVQK